jgi:PAP2 superfamily protein
VTGYAEARRLPRGWAHLLLQIAVWFGFYGAYQAARGAADRGVGEAFWNGTLVIETEHRLRMFVEPTVQDFVERSSVLVAATTYTYWLSQFAVVGIALLWIYFRHHERFADFRNWLIGANLLGLVGYVLMPTAPPRMFPEWGFNDTLSELGSVNQQSDVVLRGEPLRRDAEPPRDGRADRRPRDGLGVPLARRARPLARLAGVGVLRGDGHGQPLLARLRGGVPPRDAHRADPVPPAPADLHPRAVRRTPLPSAASRREGRA